MVNAVITYAGAIEDKKNQTSLTGSKTIIDLQAGKLKTPKIVVDFGAVQGVKNAHKFNKEIDPSIIYADYLIITHAHSDHAGMIPYLVKKGFSGTILMTELTKMQSIKMWEDYIRLTLEKIKQIKEGNDKIQKKLLKAFSLVKHIENLKNKETSKKNKIISENHLIKLFGENYLELSNGIYNEAISIIKEYGVESEGDISFVLRDVPELLFDEEDIKLALEKIKIINNKDEIEIANFHPVIKANDEAIEKLPLEVKNGRKKPLTVTSFAKGAIISKYNAQKNKIQAQIEENKKIEQKNQKLKDSLTLALNLVNWFEDNGVELEEFEREFKELLGQDENLILAQAKSLEKVSLGGETFFIDILLRIYGTFSDMLGFSKEDFEKLALELKKLKITSLKDISTHLPELPETNYENKDIKEVFKNSFFVREDENIELRDFSVFIDDLEKYSPKEIFEFFINGKRIYIKENLKEKLGEKLSNYIRENQKKLGENNEIKKSLHHAFDLIEIFDGNDDLYFSKYKLKYETAKKFISNYKFQNIQKSLYLKEELDEVIDIDFKNIPKDKKIIHIKKLDDFRIYDVLFDKNNIYYFEPKIRVRIKQKLLAKIDEIENQEQKQNHQEQKYKEYIYFVKVYEAKLLLSSYKDYFLTYEEAKKLLLEKGIKNISDIGKKDKNLLEAYNFVASYEFLQKEGFDKKELQKAKELLKKYGLENRGQIFGLNILNLDKPYTLKDLEELFGNAFIFSSEFSQNQIEIVYIENIDDDRIYDLPYIYNDKTKLIVIKEGLQEEISEKLKKGIGDFYKTRAVRRKKRQNLEEKLKLYEFLKNNYKFLFDLDNGVSARDFYNQLLQRKLEIKELRKKANKISQARKLKAKLCLDTGKQEEIKAAKKLLEKYNIKTFEDIEGVLQKLHDIPYSPEDIEIAKSLLKVVHIDKNGEILESIKLNFFNAGHIEGSVQSVITYIISEIDNTLSNGFQKRRGIYKNPNQRRLKHVNVGFSGDMGRIKQPNLAGTPENIPFVLDYYQVETTYAGRLHPDKEKSIEKLLSSIAEANGKIVIPAFSMQRTQELLITLLQARIDSLDFEERLKNFYVQKNNIQKELKLLQEIKTQIIQRENLFKEVLLHQAELRNLKHQNILPAYFGKKVKELNLKIRLKQSKIKKLENLGSLENIENKISELLSDLEKINLQISYIKPKIFDTDIILDSPLSEEITKIYINYGGGKYDILNPEVQKQIFGKEVIKYVKKKSNIKVDEEFTEDREKITLDELYSQERKEKKEIIVSASGMCDGGAIEYHLKQNLPNKNSKIIFIGYCPENTRGGKIKAKNEFISFEGKPYPLKCEVDDIAGFSAHMDEYEIVDFLTSQKFKKGAILALTHGGEERYELARKLEIIMDYIGQKVKIIVPKHGEKIDVKI